MILAPKTPTRELLESLYHCPQCNRELAYWDAKVCINDVIRCPHCNTALLRKPSTLQHEEPKQ